jgi:hypothetical protein
MANVWLAKDGAQPTRGEDPYRKIALADCIAQLDLHEGDYLCGLNSTSKFGENRPMIVKGPEHVVVEIDETEARAQGWKAGFYVSGVSVDEARTRLRAA